MEITTNGRPDGRAGEASIRIAAAGDIHCGNETDPGEVARSFAAVAERVDLILLAGDLTTHGRPQEAAILADACRPLEVPVVTVLGNHDWHCNQRDELVAVLEDAGVVVLERAHAILEIAGSQVGIAGTKGFVGGFPGAHLPDFGEPLLRAVYAAAVEEVTALDDALREIALCPFRIVLLHYAPTSQTLAGENPNIWTFLGTDRLAVPIAEHSPSLVLHGHAHAGSFEGEICGVPVFNVAVPVMGQDFWELELSGSRRMPSEVH